MNEGETEETARQSNEGDGTKNVDQATDACGRRGYSRSTEMRLVYLFGEDSNLGY